MPKASLYHRKIGKYNVYYRNRAEFEELYRENFLFEELSFRTNKKSPLIIECGAHIGMSLVYFKINYPDAKIVCFEPHPLNYKLLRQNISANKLRHVTTYNTALAKEAGEVVFYDYSESGKQPTWNSSSAGDIWSSTRHPKKYKVKTEKLSPHLKQKVDLLNIDIEGAELEVLREISHCLSNVHEIAVEFHRTPKNASSNNFFALIKILKDEGFRLRYYLKDGRRFVPDGKYLKSFDPNVFVIRGTKYPLYHKRLSHLFRALEALEEKPFLASRVIPK